MRKLILIAAMSLLVTQAQAGGSRSLSLAAVPADQPTAPAANVAQAPVTTAATTSPPAAAAQPAAPSATVTPTAATPTTTVAASTPTTTKPKHRQPSVEARVIRELHHHGIYW